MLSKSPSSLSKAKNFIQESNVLFSLFLTISFFVFLTSTIVGSMPISSFLNEDNLYIDDIFIDPNKISQSIEPLIRPEEPFDKTDDYPNQLSKLPKKSQPPNNDNNLQKEPLNFFLDHYLEDILHPKSPPQNLPVPQKLPPFRLRINPQPPQSSPVVIPTPTMNN
ncbi:hypothetical protein G9A89_002351 [Geosiphon pyriformis]|nr:hypothetical protein G9A89_002351 [Geosiphon pyriformis]